jgi:GR25 family glycosyltransferase involved in LPS biosynthesis
MMDRKEWVDDAIVGLDFSDGKDADDFRPVASKDYASTSRKRPRSKPLKPKPPPAPPASLVSLMKKDKSVLHFFTSLQENVTYDVDKWKHEAAHWKRMASSVSKQNANGTKKTNTNKRKSNKDQNKQSDCRFGGTNSAEEGSTIPITDEALFGEFSDEDNIDSAHSNDDGNVCSENAIHLSLAAEESQHDVQTVQRDNARRSQILGKLIEAKSCLDILGVSLVVVETQSPSSNMSPRQTNDDVGCTPQLAVADDDFENEQKNVELRSGAGARTIFHRQSDERVAADMMASLRTLIEASSFIKNHNDASAQQNYLPFYTYCPSVYFGTHNGDKNHPETTWKHPASVGLKHLIDALAIMDVYCHDSFDDHDWDLIFEDRSGHDLSSEEDISILKVGMKNRCHLVEKILSSLHVEITRTWANAERASNLNSPGMHFYPVDVINEENNCENPEGEFTYSVKNVNKLVCLEERIAHGRIASLLRRRLGDFQKAAELVLGYVISAAPSLGVEHYHPKIPPALSICVLESLLSPEDDVKSEINDEWFCECIQLIISSDANGCSSLLLKATAFATRTAANIWKERCSSSDKRIRDIASVEVAAYKRLLQSNGEWLNITRSDEDELLEFGNEIRSLCNGSNKISKLSGENLSPAEVGLSYIILLITIGKADEIINLCGNIVTYLKNERLKCRLFLLLPACCFAYNSIMSRRWESIKLDCASTGRHTAAAFSIKNEFMDVVAKTCESETDLMNVDIDAIIQCYKLVGDAAGLHGFARRILSTMKAAEEICSNVGRKRLDTATIMPPLLDAAASVTVRVINLERRPDRLLDFIERAVKSERMLVMRGVAKLKRKSCVSVHKNATAVCEEDEYNFAFDGQCSKDELETRIAQMTNGSGALSDFIQEEWKPSELSAFDKHAGSEFEDAHTTTSEKACALSHIATWAGVESCLSCFDSRLDLDSKAENLEKVVRLIPISGFARGPPLLNEYEGMDPSPVCVILEDDAIICDRFVERLEALLDELPRDFHFCSIGYSRPKFAPIIEYSPEIGIPSCLWYLTGYILSAAGASFLLSSLPVVGPVDHWIAVKMRDNFANRFGDSIGVGKHTRAHKVLSAKDLSKIMKFRAFAAHVPLCTQKQVSSAAQSWLSAKRDSDVVYSASNVKLH